jgi:hypothetical protein
VPFPEPPPGDDPVRAAFHDALRATPEPADLDLHADLGAVVARARTRRRRRRGISVVAAATAVALLAGGVALAASTGDGGTDQVLAGDGDTTPEPTTVPGSACLVPPAEAVGADDGSLQLVLEAGPDVAPGSVIPFRLDGDLGELGDATIDLGPAVVEWWDGTRWAHAHEVADLFDAEQPAGSGDRTYPTFGAITAAVGPLAWYRITLPLMWNDVTQADGTGTWGGFDLHAFWSVGCTPGNAPDPGADIVGCDLPAISVFLEPGLDAEQVEIVRGSLATLEEEGVLSDLSYLDRAESYARFQQLFADNPELLIGVGPSDIPTAFVASVVVAEADRVHAAVEGLPGVAQVLDAFDPMTCGTSWWLDPSSGPSEACDDLLATTTTTTVPAGVGIDVVCAELDPSTPTTTTSATDVSETCDDFLATTTTVPPDAGYSMLVDCIDLIPSDSTTTTASSPGGPAAPEPDCPVVDLAAHTVLGVLSGPVGDRPVLEITWSVNEPEAPVVVTASIDGVVLGSTGYDPADPPAELPGIVTLFWPGYPDLVIGVLADDHVLLPPGTTSYDGMWWQPSVVTDRIDELGGRLFAATPSDSDTIAAAPSPGHRYQTCITATGEPR